MNGAGDHLLAGAAFTANELSRWSKPFGNLILHRRIAGLARLTLAKHSPNLILTVSVLAIAGG